MTRFLLRFFTAAVVTVLASALVDGRESPSVTGNGHVWHEAQNWWQPAGVVEFQRVHLGVAIPKGPVTGALTLDVRLTSLRPSSFDSAGRIDRLLVDLSDGSKHEISLDWVPRQKLETRSVRVRLDTSGMPDGWHSVRLQAHVQDLTQRRSVRLVVPIETTNGNGSPAGLRQTDFEPPRAESWVVKQFAGASLGSLHPDGRPELPGEGDRGSKPVEAFASVAATDGVPNGSIGGVWRPEWHVNLEGLGVAPTFLVALSSHAEEEGEGEILINEWPLLEDSFSVPIHASPGRHRLFVLCGVKSLWTV